jgi:hypothetical protein
VRKFDPVNQTFAYLSGAAHGVNDNELIDTARNAEIPTHIAAEASRGSVRVRVLGFAESKMADADRVAFHVAGLIQLVTTEVWPAETLPVNVDLFVL